MENNLMQALMQLKNNPKAILGKYGIPQDIANDPNAIMQHLMNTRRGSQAQYNRAVARAQSMGMKR